MHMACGILVVLKLSIQTGHLTIILNSCHLEFLSPHAIGLTVMFIFDSYDHFATVTNIFRQLQLYILDTYDHVADVWFVSYHHITKVSQANISITNAQTDDAPVLCADERAQYCVQASKSGPVRTHRRRRRPSCMTVIAMIVTVSSQCRGLLTCGMEQSSLI